MVVATLLIAVLLQRLAGARALDLLFLFLIIAAPTRLGLRPAIVAAAASVLASNYFLIAPHHTLGFSHRSAL